jgi:hypothetical protein
MGAGHVKWACEVGMSTGHSEVLAQAGGIPSPFN